MERDGYTEIFEKLAGVLLKSGQDNSAEKYYKKSIELDPQNSNARYGLAQVYIGKGKVLEAERELSIFERQKEFEGRKKTLLRAVAVSYTHLTLPTILLV